MARILPSLTILASIFFMTPTYGGDDPNLAFQCAQLRSAISGWEAAAERIRNDMARNIRVTDSYENNRTAIEEPMDLAGDIFMTFSKAGGRLSAEQHAALAQSGKAVTAAANAIAWADAAKHSMHETMEKLPKDLQTKVLNVYGDTVWILGETFEAYRAIRSAHFENSYALMCR